jgi:hypothetical protein
MQKRITIAMIVTLLILVSLSCSFPLLGTSPTAVPPTQGIPPQELITATVQPEMDATATAEGGDTLPAMIELTLNAQNFDPGEEIHLRYVVTGTLDEHAWIGLFAASVPYQAQQGTSHESEIDHQYLLGNTSGTLTFVAPQEPGSYDLRLFDKDNNGQLLSKIAFTVGETQSASSVSSECNGTAFQYDASLASAVTCEIISAEPPSADIPYWEVNPEYTSFSFQDYPLQETQWQPQIYVFPVAEYETLIPDVTSRIEELEQLLVDQPSHPNNIPFLPNVNAGQMMAARVHYLSFANGSGVSFLTQYAQAEIPINNFDLLYTFQGLTSDGKWYLSATFPVSNPILPADGSEIPGGDYEQFSQNFAQYMDDTQSQLEGEPQDSFLPNLELLDELVQSLQVQ